MEKLLVISALIAAMYFIIKLLEMKYLTKEIMPLKHVIRDSFFVFISSFICLVMFLNMNGSITDFKANLTGNSNIELKTTQIFTDDPGF